LLLDRFPYWRQIKLPSFFSLELMQKWFAIVLSSLNETLEYTYISHICCLTAFRTGGKEIFRLLLIRLMQKCFAKLSVITTILMTLTIFIMMTMIVMIIIIININISVLVSPENV